MKKIASLILVIIAFQTVKAQQPSVNSNPSDSDKPYMIVQQMPTFPGGQNALFSYLKKHTDYPKSAKKKNEEGTVYVTFVIDKTGKITEVKIARGVPNAPELDAEALKVVKKMPNWIPGKQDGKNVAVQYSLPIKFILTDDNKKK